MFILESSWMIVAIRRFLVVMLSGILYSGLCFAEDTIVHPVDHGMALNNPGMGFVFHHYDNSAYGYGEPLGPGYDGSTFPGLNVVYLRIAWSYLEPREGDYQWALLDTVIQRYLQAGKRFAFRFTTFETEIPHGTPKWLQDAGCPGYLVKVDDVENWEPDYSAPLYLEKLERFLMAAGRRYGNHPALEFVDVGTIGVWGEGHAIAKQYPMDVLKKHIELHKKAFPKTWIVGMDDWSHTFRIAGDPESESVPMGQPDMKVVDWMFQQGITIRDDSLNVYKDPKAYYAAHLVQQFWPTRPVVIEMGHYGYAKRVGAWGGERYLQAVKDYHASFASIHANPNVFLAENQELIDQINQCLGYRFHLDEAKWPATLLQSSQLVIDSKWSNVGVAPYLGEPVYPVWTLVNDENHICAVWVDETLDMRNVPPSSSQEQSDMVNLSQCFVLPVTLKGGTYTLCISLGDPCGTPLLELPYHNLVNDFTSCTLQKRYPVGKLTITP